MPQQILILDFGSQYTQLIARRVRELNVYCEIHPFNKVPELNSHIKGVILSGSPCSVRQVNAPDVNLELFRGKVPVLGICYGAQLIAQKSGGNVEASSTREYGRARLSKVDHHNELLKEISLDTQVWMSHGDTIKSVPTNFEVIASTSSVENAAYKIKNESIYGIQFHPEVTHTTEGKNLLRNFVVHICACAQDWTPDQFIETTVADLQSKLGNDQVVMALSGGVDSTVAAMLVHKAIGKTFIDVFDEESHKIENAKWLGQGTIYPDVIESAPVMGPSQTIKSHHNVGGLPEKMKLKVVEPLNTLFKDEVRLVGKTLGIDPLILGRHPFPGPGLGIRILGEITAEKVAILQEVDAIFIGGLRNHGLYDKVWQAGAMLLPIQSVGVMGDERTYERVVALRAVSSIDGMTADWVHLPYEFLAEISNEIINKVKGVNRVVYDISSKPPATIEWE